MINLNFRASTPIYEQVKEHFRSLILSGVLPEGYKMPSVRELASELAINPNTIQRAYRELEQEGCICSVPGKGSFVCDMDQAIIARRQELKADFVKLVQELKALGLEEEELIGMLKGGNKE